MGITEIAHPSFPRKNVTPYHDTGQESSLPSLPTLDYRRKDCRHFHLPWCRWQPAWLIPLKIGSVKPVVGATLVVARSRRQPVFIPLCGLRNAMVILRSAATKNLQSLPRRADRGRQERNCSYDPAPPPCHSSENSLCSTAHPSFRRRACPVPRYGAGIQSPVPANTRPSTERLSPLSSSMVPVATGMANCYENRLRQTCCRGNPCGCPFPAPTRFHPLMWPSECHGHSEKRSDEESTISPPPTERLPIPISPPPTERPPIPISPPPGADRGM